MAEFRLESLHVENFRSISGNWTIPLDGQVVLVHGPNGAGKTSLLSAIELAATGDVGFLRNQPGELHEVLLNRNYPVGSVQLRLRSPSSPTRTGVIRLDESGLEIRSVLDEAERLVFLERCFLPQTALGRLLETYTETGKQVDTALVRFVKSIVGIDDLDNLIEGLWSAGHLARARAASDGWQSADDELAHTLASQKRSLALLEDTQAALAREAGTLRTLLGPAVEGVPDGDLARYVAARRSPELPSPVEQNRYESLRVRLEGVAVAYSEGLNAQTHIDPALEAESANRAAAAYNAWEGIDGARALQRINEIRANVFGLHEVPASQIFEAFEDAQERARQEIQRRAAARQSKLEAEELRSQLDLDLTALDAEIALAEAKASAVNVPSDVRVLIDILERTIPLATTEKCPVCDQQFSHGRMRLRDHLEAKAASLSRGANELIQANDRVQRLRAEAARLSAEIQSTVFPPTDDAPPESLVRALNSLDETITTGLGLLQELRHTQSRLAEATSRRATLEVADRHLAAIRDELGVDSSGLQVSEELRRLSGLIEKESQAASYQQALRSRKAAALHRLEERTQEAGELREQLATIRERTSALEASLARANDRKKAANDVRLAAERVRSSVINDVFDQTLNTLWADLFGRLVPSEPFVPRFRKQSQAKRTVDIHLETVLPNGEPSGSPAAMLSYGNTNTAALSLFIALHLAAPTDLPWLIFDDPVQSMDDIHVANFATVIRQLSYSHGRQVVIAVHQRELFEYLSLELAPASPGEALIRVTLDRHGEATLIDTERVEHEPEPSLLDPQSGAHAEERIRPENVL